MTAAEFVRRWAAKLPDAEHARLLIDLTAVVRYEQDRERRRLCTDQAYYRRSVDQTMSEFREHMGART